MNFFGKSLPIFVIATLLFAVVVQSHPHPDHLHDHHHVHEPSSPLLRKGKIQGVVDDAEGSSKTKPQIRCKYSNPGFAENVESKMFHPDTPRVQVHQHSASSSTRRKLAEPPFEPIRITASFLDLDDSSKYCTTVGEAKPDMSGGTKICSAEHILTAAKRDLLKNVIIPFAIAKLQKVLFVQRFLEPLQAPSTDICDGGFTAPQSYVDVGVANTDYLLLVAGGPDDTSTIAWCGGCAMTNDVPVPRVAIGRANFNPIYLDITENPLAETLRTALHEILHGFGFTHGYLTYAGLVRDVTIRNRNLRGIISPLALETARNYFGCQTLVAVELEDEGGSGTVNSHLNRRVYKNNLMAGTGGASLSVIELAIMNDIGVFKVNYTQAEPVFFGRGAGCAFSDTTCPTSISSSGASQRHQFCDATTPSVGCTSDLEGYGPCSTSSFLTDTCEYYVPYSDSNCIKPAQGNLSDYGESYHADSRCYDTASDFKKTGTGSLSFTNRCIQSRCSFVPGTTTNQIQVQLRVGSMDTWQTCTTANQQLTVPGYDGVIKCPSNLQEMCASIMATGRTVPSDPAEAESEIRLKVALKENAVPEFLATQWTVFPSHLTTAAPGSAGFVEVQSVAGLMFLVILMMTIH